VLPATQVALGADGDALYPVLQLPLQVDFLLQLDHLTPSTAAGEPVHVGAGTGFISAPTWRKRAQHTVCRQVAPGCTVRQA
jgi:hypothetical protein